MIDLVLHQFGKVGIEALEDMGMTIEIEAFEGDRTAARHRHLPSRNTETIVLCRKGLV